MNDRIFFTLLTSLLLTAIAGGAEPSATREQFDVVIKGGTVYDGTGGKPRVTDVAILRDRIADLGIESVRHQFFGFGTHREGIPQLMASQHPQTEGRYRDPGQPITCKVSPDIFAVSPSCDGLNLVRGCRFAAEFDAMCDKYKRAT